jgi:hypothetical protein
MDVDRYMWRSFMGNKENMLERFLVYISAVNRTNELP